MWWNIGPKRQVEQLSNHKNAKAKNDTDKSIRQNL